MTDGYSYEDIVGLYVTARNKDEQVFILAQLTASDPETIIEILKDYRVYNEQGIQPCFNCKQLFISRNRKRICPACVYRNKKAKLNEFYRKRKELR